MVSYLLSDHLGSTSLATDASGAIISEMRYTAWGEVRHESGTTPTEYTYTGQYSYTADFGLMFYREASRRDNARWYDPALGRFAQADTLIPGAGNPQAWDRYAYGLNNPVKYNDPSGHYVCEDLDCDGPPINGNGGGGGGGDENDKSDDTNNGEPSLSDANQHAKNIAAMANLLDTIAFGFNGVYAVGGDLVSAVCAGCEGGVLGIYQFYSFTPNAISTVSMGLWIFEGVLTGTNSYSVNQTPEETVISFSVSQDTVVAIGTNIAGWTVLREPNLAAGVDAAVVGYDYGRSGVIPGIDIRIPEWINPHITYSSSSGFNFSWTKD